MAKKKTNDPVEILRQDLLDQLERNGAVGSYYEDMVEDWITYWKAKDELSQDIKDRGSKIEKYDSRGQKQIVNNESLDIIIKMNTQMQKILEFLKLSPPDEKVGLSPEDLEM